MRPLYRLLCLPLLGLSYAAHAQQPFLKYGVTVKVATLSHGRFPEFFANDSLRRIGSVVYNTRLHRIAYLLPPDSLVGHAQPDVASRWMSPDPLAEKYMYITPYAFGNNNPVRYADIDGREIIDSKGKAVTVGKDGAFVYAGKDASVITFISEMSKNAEGREALTGLINVATKVSVEITEGRGNQYNPEVEGHTDPTNSLGRTETIVDPKTGETVYKKAEITIYTGTHADEVKTGKGDYAKSSVGKFINGVGTHEGWHVLNNLRAEKKARQENGGTKPTEQQLDKAQHEVPIQKEKDANNSYPTP